MIGERRPFWRKVAPPLPKTCQCGSRPPPHLSRLFTGGEAARRSVSRTAVNNERSLSSSFVQSGACVHRNNRRHPVRESRRAAFFRFLVSSFSFEMYTVEEICIRECCGQGFDKHESLWKGRDAVSYTHLDVYKRQVMASAHVINILSNLPISADKSAAAIQGGMVPFYLVLFAALDQMCIRDRPGGWIRFRAALRGRDCREGR